MRIILNHRQLTNIKSIFKDPAIDEVASFWDKKQVFEKSAIALSKFHTDFPSISLLYGPRQIGKTASLILERERPQ